MQLRNKERGELGAKHTKFNNIAVTVQRLFLTMGTKKKPLYLFCVSNNVVNTKVLIWDTNFMSPTGDRTAILRGHPRHAKVVGCSAKGIPSFPSYFKTLSIGPAAGIKPGLEI